MLSLKSILLQVGIVLLLPVLSLVAAQCDPVTKSNGIVCRCNSTYCDKIQSHPAITVDKIVVYTSSQAGKRLEMEVLSIPNSVVVPSDAIPVKLNGLEHQKILGFGGSFTDAAAYVLSALPNAAQDKFISSYFSRQGGARYSMGRVPLGGADFSRKSYSLVQTANDFALSDFAIQDDNSVPGVDYKLNLILRALQEIGNTSAELSQVLKEFKVFASIWSAPVWMKTCKSPPAPSGTNSCGSGFIPWILGRPKNPTFLFGGLSDTTAIRNAYTQYWLKFLRAYNQSGVSLWGLSPQNEPGGNPTGNKWDNTNYSPQDLVNFVNQFLGPAVKSVFPNMKIIIGDDQLPTIPDYASRAVQSSYIDGVGYHWYNTMAGSLIGTGVLVGDVIGGQIEVSKAANQYSMNNRGSNKFLLMTEACTGYVDNVVEPGSWERGYNYMTDILHELESGSAGWVDWNLALNMSGGPNHAGNTVDAPILIDSTVGEFYKQPMYYALAHFSTFVPPGAIRLGITNANLGFIGPDLALEVIAFRQAENSDTCVLVIANDHLTASLPARGFSDVHTVVFELPSGKKMLIEMGEHEFKSILFHCPLPQGSLLNNDAPEANQVTIALASGGAGILCIAGVLGAFILVRRRAAKRKLAEPETATEIATTRPNAPSI